MYFQSTEEHVHIILCLQFVHIHSVFKEINALTCSANAVECSFPNNPWVSCSFSMYSNTSADFSEYVGSFTHLYAMYAIAASAKCIVICIKHCSRLKCLLEYFGQSTPYSNIALITKYVEALQRELVVLKHIWREPIVLKHWRRNKWCYHFACTTSPLNIALKTVKTSSKSFNNMAVRTNREKIFEKCK